MHRWTDGDNLIAFCYYRLGLKDHTFGIDPSEMGQILGMGMNSLALKVANFKAIDGPGGLDGYSLQAIRIYREYQSLTNSELREVAIAAVARALERYTNR